MAFQQGLSGLNASSKSIDVISNNIANAGTVGFKASQAHFSEVYAASLQGSGAAPVGIGVSLLDGGKQALAHGGAECIHGRVIDRDYQHVAVQLGGHCG